MSVWSPSAQNASPSPPTQGDVGDDRFGSKGGGGGGGGGEDSLLTNAEVVVGAVSSILQDSDLIKWKPCALRRL